MKGFYVKSETHKGCAIACMAMILGKSFKEVRELYHTKLDIDNTGLVHSQIDNLFSELGYSVRRLYRYNHLTGKLREPWPIIDQPISLVMVRTAYNTSHYVVVRDGKVFDPDNKNIKNLSSYIEVIFVSSYHKIKKESNMLDIRY